MENTPNLVLPYIIAAQAQKHVTHNEAIRSLDALVQISVLDKDGATPPASPAEGARYIVAASPTGAWAGQAGRLAAYQDGAWAFCVPREGWLAWVADEDKLYVFDGTAWMLYANGVTSVNPVAMVGVNATADTTNRLAVKSNAALFSHDDVTPGTGDMRVVYNKSAAARTASLLYQTGYSGRAEIGTTGDDKLHVKMSADGTAWTEAVVVTSAGDIGFGTSNPSGLGGNVVLVRNQDSPAIAKVSNSSGSANAQARFDLATGVANSYAIFGLANGAGSPYFIFSGGSGVTGMYLDWNVHVFRSPTGVERMRIDNSGNTLPGSDNTFTLGSASRRWSNIYAANGTINTSDEREKDIVSSLSGKAGGIVDGIEPILFRWIDGGSYWEQDGTETVPHPQTGEPMEQPHMVLRQKRGARVHAGFSAQQVRPDELLPVLWQAVRELRAEVAELRGSRGRG